MRVPVSPHSGNTCYCLFLILSISEGEVSSHFFFFFETEFHFCRPGWSAVGAISTHCHLHLLGSSNSSASASQVAGIAGMHHHTWLIFVFLVEVGFRHVGQAGLKLLASGNPPAFGLTKC